MPSQLLSKKLKNKIYLCYKDSIVSYIKGGMQAKDIWKQDPEANIWAQEGFEWRVEKAP